MTAPGEPSAARSFLQQIQAAISSEALFPADIFRQYAHYLIDTSGARELPVPLERIRQRHGFQFHPARLPQRGFLLGDTIFVNSDDPATVQRFTEAHEMMETLVTALRDLGLPARLLAGVRDFEREKEQWCELGAAELLMPADLFTPHVTALEVSLASARRLAGLCHTSLTAAARKMLETGMKPCIFALLKEGHKKAEYIPSKVGQGVLWGSPTDWDPPAKLRVWRRWSSPQVKPFLCFNESFSRDGRDTQVLPPLLPGAIRSGHWELDFEQIKGRHFVELMPVTIDGLAIVMMLIHLPGPL